MYKEKHGDTRLQNGGGLGELQSENMESSGGLGLKNPDWCQLSRS